MDKFSWTTASALWEIKSGTSGTERLQSAAAFLADVARHDEDEAATIALNLLAYVPVLRAVQCACCVAGNCACLMACEECGNRLAAGEGDGLTCGPCTEAQAGAGNSASQG